MCCTQMMTAILVLMCCDLIMTGKFITHMLYSTPMMEGRTITHMLYSIDVSNAITHVCCALIILLLLLGVLSTILYNISMCLNDGMEDH